MKTAKIATAVCFELDCPDCGPESQVEGPAGSLFSTVEEFVVEGKLPTALTAVPASRCPAFRSVFALN